MATWLVSKPLRYERQDSPGCRHVLHVTIRLDIDDGAMNHLPDVSAGATWRCIDFHLHTPGVPSFMLPGGSSPDTATGLADLADQYVKAMTDVGIEIGVITDYQGVREDWYIAIRDKATPVGIYVLPGAELSIGRGGGRGLHLLLICDPDSDPNKIEEVIRHQGRKSDRLFAGRSQHKDLDLRGDLSDALRAIRDELGCVVIAPHASGKNGVLRELGPKHAAMLVRDGLIDAIDNCEDAARSLQGTGELSTEQLLSLACTFSSDPHSLEQIGTATLPAGRRRLTWIKLSTVEADAIRLALHDPRTRVLTRPPAPVQHPRILSMEVDGGFLTDLAIRFNDDLTVLIGGRGAGKSAILETLRYGLGGTPYSDHSERSTLVEHAMGSGGRVRLVIDRPGPQQHQLYQVTRVHGQQPRVTDLLTGEAVAVMPMELFGTGGSPVILLQREIQAVARDDAFRRRLLDEIIGDDARQADAAVRRTVEQLARSRREIEEVERQLARRDEHEERLHRLRAEISYFEQQGVSEMLERHSRASADKARLDSAIRRVAEALTTQQEASSQLAEQLDSAAAELRKAESEHAADLKATATEVEIVRKAAGDALTQIKTKLAHLSEILEQVADTWPIRVADLDEDLRRIELELGAVALKPGRYVDAVGERTALEPIVQGLARREKERDQLLEQRQLLLRQLQDQRRNAFKLRQLAAEAVNQKLDRRLQLNITYLGDADTFKTRLVAILKGSRVTTEAIESIVDHTGIDGVELVRLVDQGEATVANTLGISSSGAERLVHWLTAEPTRRRQVEVLAPDDRVSVSLFVDESPRDLNALSSGQKATAVLLLLFAQGSRPLVLDQPEDDLDNRFVYEDVVTLLRDEKGIEAPEQRRQIIAATHNANIPVNGDAELVLSLVDEQGRCAVRTRASIDNREVRKEIRTVLEGGAEAFRRRAEKYGGLDDT